MAYPLYSIGHSNHSLERFFALLRQYEIEVLADVRSKPYTRYSTHFNGPALKQAALDAGFKYLFLGKEMGGMPDNRDYYDEDGHLDYARVAAGAVFQHGLSRLKNGIDLYKVVLMCGEENPQGCHRRNLIAKELAPEGIIINHIRADGAVQTEDDLLALEREPDDGQLKLF